jgi:hypothetical protein
MRVSRRAGAIAAVAALGLVGAAGVAGPATARSHHHDDVKVVTDGLNGPRGVATVRPGTTLVSESDGTVSMVRERRHRAATVRRLTSVPAVSAPAIASGRHGTVYILTGVAGGPEGTDEIPADVIEASSKLYKWRPGWAQPRVVADIAAYQATDPDPNDLEDNPTDSNPYGVVALRHGRVLVSDAAGNDLLMVNRHGHVRTVAMLKPRVVPAPEGAGLPAGSPVPTEAVATSVTVGSDGYYYVGELRGFPGTPGHSEIWRIRPGSHNAVCDPEAPKRGACKRYADGLTSIVDLAPGRHGSIYALTLSKMSWLAIESDPPVPGSEIGGLFKVSRWGHHVRELAADQLILPGAVDASRRGGVYVTSPQFGPGALLKVRR